ncbi:hypothetical protein E2P81_ATG11542 [Venturia nashicola]|nr:hypothetical protein E2P81_ATG11542 [Venturia nashicola]
MFRRTLPGGWPLRSDLTKQKNAAQNPAGANGQAGPSSNVINIQEVVLDRLEEFLEESDDVERATVGWFPQPTYSHGPTCACSCDARVRSIPKRGTFAPFDEDHMIYWIHITYLDQTDEDERFSYQ